MFCNRSQFISLSRYYSVLNCHHGGTVVTITCPASEPKGTGSILAGAVTFRWPLLLVWFITVLMTNYSTKQSFRGYCICLLNMRSQFLHWLEFFTGAECKSSQPSGAPRSQSHWSWIKLIFRYKNMWGSQHIYSQHNKLAVKFQKCLFCETTDQVLLAKRPHTRIM